MRPAFPRLPRLSLLAAAAGLALAPTASRAANLYWDANGTNAGVGGTGSWDAASAFWSTSLAGTDAAAVGAFTSADIAYFAGQPGDVTLASPTTIGGLVFVADGYRLGGATLTLVSADPQVAPEVFVGRSLFAELGIGLAGSEGFTKTGGGTLRLTAGATFTGLTTIANGALVITRGDALGSDASPVTILGSATRGQPGGQLVLAGGLTFARDISLQGQGPIADRSATLLSVGDNVLTGALSGAVGLMNNRIISEGGLLTLAGSLDIAGSAGSQFVTLGGINARGNGNYLFTGALTGAGSFNKDSTGTLLLRPADTSGFTGVVRATGGTIRVESVGVFGTRTAAGTGGVLDMNGGSVEFRLDDPNFGATRNVYHRGSSTAASFFADHAVGSYDVLNRTVAFGQFAFEENLTFVFNSRNGFGYAFTTAPVQGGTNNSTITNNAGGTVLFTGNFWSNTDNAANRTMTLNGAGNTTLGGNLVASAGTFDHVLTKSGAGLLRIVGTGSTLDGAVNINDGALAITDFRSINNANAGRINIGTGGTAGRLIVGETGGTPSAAGLITNKVVNLAGTTGAASIAASQPGANPVVFNAAFLATGAGAKTLVFTGSNVAENLVAGAIVENGGAVAIQKNGPGTWAFAGANTFTGNTLITNGTLRLKDTFAAGASRNLMPDAGTFTFQGLTATQDAGGTLEYVGAAGAASVERLGTLNLQAGAATIRVSAGLAGTSALEFTGFGTTDGSASLNVITGAGASLKVGTGNGFATQRVYFNGADIGVFTSGVVRAPVYGTDSGFSAVNTFVSANHGYLTADASTGAITQKSLKLEGSLTLTLTGVLTTNNGTNTGGNLLATGGASRITGANITGPGTAPLAVRVNQASDVLTIDGSLTGFSGGLNKNGEGRLVLNGNANAFTGAVNLNEGEIELGAGVRLGGDGVTTFSSLNLRQWGVLDLGGNVVGFNNFNGSGLVTNGAAVAATFIVGNNAGTGTWTGVFQDGAGVLNVTKAGTGAQNWHGLATHTGFTRIDGTGLVDVQVIADIGQASGLGAGNALANAGSLIFGGSTGGLNYSGSVRLLANTFGSASASTDRLFTLAGTGATLSSTASNGNAIVWRNTGDVVHAVVGPQTLFLTGTSTGDNALFPRLTDSGSGADVTSVSKTGAGVWVLGNAANAYSGLTTVGNGTLIIASAGSLPSASPLALGDAATAGVLQAEGTFIRPLAASAVPGAGGVTWAGTAGGGFAAAGSSLVVALGGLGSPSLLTWGQGGFVPAGASLHLSSAVALGLVDFRNPIDLAGAARTVNVNDNGGTFTDYAVLSGVIGNGAGVPAGLVKAGSGLLVLAGQNTYDGTTTVSAGQLVVSSFGRSTVAGASSLGSTAGANLDANALLLGNAGTGGGILTYVGPGEVSDRKIRLNTTTGNTEIHASGTGPLVLTNLANDLSAGAKTLFLRGSNVAGNAIDSVLADNGGALTVQVDGAAVWILGNAGNTYSGATNLNAGALGVPGDTVLGASLLSLGSGSIFALGGDRTIANAVQIQNNSTVAFVGDHGFTFTQPLALRSSDNSSNLTNNLPAGKPLVFPSVTANDIGAARTWTVNGSGDTVILGDITTNKTFALGLTYSGTGSLTLGGANSVTNGGAVTVSNGTLRLGADGVLANLLAGPAVVTPFNLTLNPAAGATATLDLNGRSDTLRGLAASAGTAVLANSAATAATLTFGSGDQAFALNGSVTNVGAGAFNLVKVGAGTAVFSGGSYGHKGNTDVQGGVLTFNGPVTAGVAFSVSGGGRLALAGGHAAAGSVRTLAVGPGATFSLAGDNVGTPFSALTSLSLGTGAGAGTATVALNIGDSLTPGDGLNTDGLALAAGGVFQFANTVTFNLSDAGLNPGTTYTLLSVADGGLTALGPANFIQGATPGGFDSFAWAVSDTAVTITTGNLIVGTSYWRGLTGTTWNGAADNWSQDKAGTVPAVSIPGQGTDVVFQWNAASAAAVSTTLEQNFKINSLVFEAASTPALTPVSVDIGPGAAATNRLEIAPQLVSAGLAILSGGPATVNLTSAVKLGRDQTWSVVDAGSVLSLGSLQGEADVTKSGAGRVVLTADAAPNFNPGATADFLVTGGVLELRSGAALGTANAANLATIRVDAGAFYVNAASATLANRLTFAGGVLSAGTATQSYAGLVTLLGAATVNMRENNSATLTTTQRSINLTGGVTGAGRLTVDSINTLSNLNQLTGNLTISNAENTGWTGGMEVLRGTVTTNRAAGFGTGPIALAAGKLAWTGGNGAQWTIPNDITIAAAAGAAYGELNLDNVSGTVAAPFTANFTGALTVGGAGYGEARIYLADGANTVANFTGPITLANNAGLNFFAGGSTVVLDAVIGETGGARSLALNPAGWTTTSAVLQLRGANTFSGDVSVGAGLTVEFGTVTDAGGAASNLGRGANITLGGGTLSFTGQSSQSTNRGLTATANANLRLAGASAATMSYAGAFNAGAFNVVLTAASSAHQGFLSGGITQTGTGADLYVNSGRWTLGGATSNFADDVVVTGADARLILSGTGSLAYVAGTSNGLYARNGATIALASDHVSGAANEGGLDFILLGDTTPGLVGTLEMGGYALISPRLDLGNRAAGLEGAVTGPGLLTLTTASSDWSSGVRLLRGVVSADLAGGASFIKFGSGLAVLSGANAGLTNSTVATRVDEGELRLDFGASAAAKLPTLAPLDFRGGSLVLQAGAAPASQAFAGLVLTQGHAVAELRAGASEGLLLDFGAVTRSAGAGTLRLVAPAGGFDAGRGFATVAANDATGSLGAHLTLSAAGASWFARNDAGRIVALASQTVNSLSAWTTGAHVTDGGAGFSGQAGSVQLGSLRFGAAGGSAAVLSAGAELVLQTGGLLVSEGITSGSPSLTGGGLRSLTGEIVLTQHSAQPFELGTGLLAGTSLTKAGEGTLILSGANRNGAVQIQSGLVQLAGGAALEDATLVTLSTYQPSTLQLLASETIGRLAGGNATADSVYGLVDVGSHVLTLRPTANATYSGQLTGTGTIVKNGLVGETTLNGISSGFTGLLRINQAGFALSGLGAIGATRIEVNGAGFLLINNNGDTRSNTRIPDSTPLVLNSAAGTRVNETLIRGVWLTADRNVSISETIGNLVFGSGASYISGNATGTTGVAGLIASNFVRQNGATAIIRGRALGATSGDRNLVRIGDATADAAFLAGLTGGAGAAGTATMSIVPWMVGETLSAAYGDANMGNSLMTYVSGLTLRPLNLATEYAAYATAGATNNTREALAGNLIGLAGRTVNSLSLHASNATATTYAFTGAGAAQALTNTSGAFLFTLNPASTNSAVSRIDLGGFDAGLLVGGSEYLFHVQNPSTALNAGTLVVGVASPLGSAADIVKSGRGTLILQGASLAGGGARRTVLNEGILEIADLDAIGGDTGSVIFAGGTLRFGAGFADDLFGRDITILEGGIGLDTNGVDQTLSSPLGTGVGGVSKYGAGDLTLNAPISNGGPVLVAGGRIVFGVSAALASGWDLQLGDGTTAGSLDLGSSDFTVTALNAFANSPSASVLTVGAGRVLRVEGDVLLSNRSDGAATRLTLAGGGDLVVVGSGIVVGQNGAGTNFSSSAFLDLSGLNSFTAELSNRLVIQLQGDNSSADYGVLTLSAGLNRITVPTILVGGSGAGSSNNALRLGAAGNVLRTDFLRLGSGNRDGGRVEFQSAAGTFTLRNQAGDGRALVSLGNNSAQATGYVTSNLFDLDGHVVDLAIGTYVTAPFSRTGANNHDFRFDAGVVDVLNLNLAVAKGTGVSTSLFRIAGGELLLGGSAAFGDAGTGSVSLGTAGAGELRIEGGVVRSSVAIGRSAGAGSGTLTLAGGVLDLGGNDLGSAAAPLTLALTSGTLRNYGQLNGGAALVKSGAGTLILDGSSGHSAAITIGAGTLQVGAGGATGTLGGSDVANSGTLAFDRTGTLVVPGLITGSGDLRKEGAGTVVLTGANVLAGSAVLNAGVLQLGAGGTTGGLTVAGFTLGAGATLRFDRSDDVDFNAPLTGAVGSVLEQAGPGRTRLTAANLSFAGDVAVTAGELDAGVIDALSSARDLIVAAGGTLTVSVDDATGYGLGPDLVLQGGVFRLLAGSGDAVSASLRDLELAGGVISAGLVAASGNSLVVKGRIDVTQDTVVSARQVAFVNGGTSAAATEVAVAGGKTLTFSGTLADEALAGLPTAFDKRGAGTLVLSGDNSRMTGASAVAAGILDVRHVNALGNGVATNLVTFQPAQTTVSGGMLVSDQAGFATAGAVAGAITVASGGAIGVAAPGAAVIGNLKVADLTLQGGSRVDFKLWDLPGGLGVGYDRLDLGALDLTGASSANRITIKLISMSAANAFGDSTLVKPTSPLEFVSFSIGSYDPLQSNLGSGNVSDLFRFDASEFTYANGSSSDAGLWTVDFNGGAITLTAVPEPSTYGFGLGALALAAAALRRRKRQEKKA